VVVAGTASADPDPAFEKQARDEIAAVSADAATAWDAANAARDAKRADEAEAGYRKVIALAPKIDHPHRRLCNVLAARWRVDAAIAECEQALQLAPTSAYNESSYAKVLILRNQPGDRNRALTLASQAVKALPNDPTTVGIQCVVYAAMNNVDELRPCTDHLLELEPKDMYGNLYAAQLALIDRDPEHASIYLERAKDAGLGDEDYRPLRAKIDRLRKPSEPLIDSDQAIAIGVPAVLGWFLVLVLLLIGGNVLSDATLRRIDGDSLKVSRVYRVVLALTAVLFYASLPVMVFVVIGGGLLTLYIFDQMGATPLYVLGLVLLAIVGTVAAVIRTIFAARRFEIEGHKVDPAGYPGLKALLDEVAAAVGTRAIDTVYLVPGTEVAVTQHRRQRILILGVALFDNMKQRELRSVLAHEYGHFKNADTGGAGALSLQATLIRLLKNMAKYGALNPAWWILRAFTHLYLVVSRGASRVQETLADRWAIRAYGSEAFVAAHRHIATRAVEMGVDLDQTIKDVVENQWSLPNFYQYAVERTVSQAALDKAVAQRLDRTPDRFDTHPSTRQRIELAEKLAMAAERTSPDDAAPVWDLFTDPDQIERTMTAILRERISKKLGIAISGEEWEDESA
jgi:Zn-dependent protease with chaperone function